MSYKIVQCEWINEEMLSPDHTITFQDRKDHFQMLYSKNMDTFVQLVNDEVVNGWTPVGAPHFSGPWEHNHAFRTHGVAIQALFRPSKKNT